MNRAIFSLLTVTALAYGARSFVPSGQTITGSGAALAFGFLIIAALQMGKLAEAARSPHLTGYIICGLLFGPEVLNIVSSAMLADLTLVKGTAVGLIALLAGCELNFRQLRPALRAISAITIATMLAVAAVLWILFYWIISILPATATYGSMERAAIALLCANVLAAFSPAVVIGLINETRASGPLTQLCMSIVVLGDLAMVITFSMSSAGVRGMFPAMQGGGADGLVAHIFGSIFVGILVGIILAIYIRRVGTRTGLVVFALLFVVAEAGRVLHIDPLLVGLAAGLLLENASPVSGHEVARVTEPLTLPTFAIFFAVVGAEVQLGAFLHVAVFAIAAAVVRAAGIWFGVAAGSKIGRVDPRIGRLVPFGLLPQAGVAIALAVLVLNDFEPWGRVVGTILLGSIVVNQLIAPVLFRIALIRAGEVPGFQPELATPVPQLHPR
jgi:Kef-type K+ transport system membrane component KefB